MKEAVDTEALETDGLDLDLAQQLADMSLKPDAELEEPEVKDKVKDMFEIDGELLIQLTMPRDNLSKDKGLRLYSRSQGGYQCSLQLLIQPSICEVKVSGFTSTWQGGHQCSLQVLTQPWICEVKVVGFTSP